jgi:hypothetical protein
VLDDEIDQRGATDVVCSVQVPVDPLAASGPTGTSMPSEMAY